MTDFTDYLVALAGYGKWLLTGGPFLAENVLKRIKPSWIRWLDERIPPAMRIRVEVAIFLAAVFLAGFFVWNDERVTKQALVKNLQAEALALKAEIATLQSKLDDREAERKARVESARVRDAKISVITDCIADGNRIARDFEEHDDKDAVMQQYRAWEQTVLSVLSQKFDPSYVNQFASARSIGMTLMNHNYEGGGWWSLLQGKLNVLNSFLTELRKQ